MRNPIRTLFRSASLHRLFAAIAIACTIPVTVAATHATATTLLTLNSQWSTTARNARLSAINTAAANGFLDFQSGAQPANADAAVTGTQLCSVALGASPFTTPSAGAMSNASTLTCTGTAGATGTGTAAGYVVLYKADHTTVLEMGSVGTSSANITLPSTTITTGETVSFASGAYVLNDNAAVSGQ